MKNAWQLSSALIVTLMFVAGCGPQAPSDTATPPTPGDQAPTTVAERLAAADALDGKVDHVIEHCYPCALGMKGKPELTSKTDGYTLHFCSEGCLEHFGENTQEVIASTEIPTKKSE
ncbi:MAG: hypothetical protein KDB14_02680 [Planctomycetales bacterium]|nr:hypothetical protein [Planctomycetales bacterium]